MKCLFFFGISSMKEDTSAQLSGRGELHWGAITLVTLRKCTKGFKRVTKILELVLASARGFYRGLGLDQALQEGQGSDFFLLGAALRIRATMKDHDIWKVPGSPGYQGHASGQRRPRSQDVPEPPRQATRRNSPERPRGPPPGEGSLSGTYSSFLQPFAPRRSAGSRHASGCKAARRNNAKRQRTLVDPAAAAARRLPRHGESSSMRIW